MVCAKQFTKDGKSYVKVIYHVEGLERMIAETPTNELVSMALRPSRYSDNQMKHIYRELVRRDNPVVKRLCE